MDSRAAHALAPPCRAAVDSRSSSVRRFATGGALLSALLVFVWAASVETAPALAAEASIQPSAVVIGGNISVTGQRALDFQDVMAGGTYDVAFTSSTSGHWQVTGTPGAEVQLTFLLPPALISGPHSMPINFLPNHAGHFTFNAPGFATVFDPQLGAVAKLRSFFGGTLYVWLGGSISPSFVQHSGLYTGTVTLVASYTGS